MSSSLTPTSNPAGEKISRVRSNTGRGALTPCPLGSGKPFASGPVSHKPAFPRGHECQGPPSRPSLAHPTASRALFHGRGSSSGSELKRLKGDFVQPRSHLASFLSARCSPCQMGPSPPPGDCSPPKGKETGRPALRGDSQGRRTRPFLAQKAAPGTCSFGEIGWEEPGDL